MRRDGTPDSGAVVTSRELTAAGVSAARLRALVRDGRLARVCRGVYAPAQTVAAAGGAAHARDVLRAAAAVAVAGQPAAGSHEWAALLHGLDLLEPLPGRVTVTRPPRAPGSRTARPGVRLHVAGLPAAHVALAQGVRVTSVARTVVDLARTSTLRAGVVAADSALRRGLVSPEELAAMLCDCAGWPGIRQARQTVELSDGRSESALESLSRVVFREQGLPAPELQAWVGGEFQVIGRADFLWRRYRTIAEADGKLKYADPGRAVSQLQRDARLREAGFEVVHFTWGEIIRVPHQVAAAIRVAFRRGAPAGH
jgi:hypothetical protein